MFLIDSITRSGKMESSYLERYKIIQTYKESEFQKVFVGTDNQNNQAVVINNIYIKENDSIKELANQNYKDIFDSVVHFEKTDDEITIITEAKVGLSLNEYLTDFNPTFTERINLIYQYLNNIKKYNPLPNNIKSILVDEPQIIITDGKISLGDLIIFNENTFTIEDFKEVKNNIISILQRLTSLPHINYEELPLYIEVVEFIDKLRKNDEIYNNIEKIFDGFEGLNINNLSEIDQKRSLTSSDNSPVEKTVGSINKDTSVKIGTSKNRPVTIAIGAAGIITTVLVGMFVFKSILPLGKNLDSDADLPPNEIIGIDDPIENKYTEDVESANDNKVTEPNNNINYLSEDIEKDFTTSKYSNYSFKISNDNDKSHKITIEQGLIQAHSQLLMWIKSDTPDEFNITVEGYSDENLSLRQSILHKPSNVNSWELVRFTLNKNIDDYVDIIFDNINGTIWVDKISIDIFK